MNEPSTLSGRPRFFEGQYLSADDLAAIVAYLRGAGARHALAAHTPGIAVGLYLLERNAAGAPNRREVILQPGFAWDGFGRAIAVAQPTRLPETLFASIAYAPAVDGGPAPVGRLVKVWLAYRETESRGPAPGFENCLVDDQNSRVLEEFEFRIGDLAPGPEQRDNVIVGTESLEPQDELKHFDAAAPTLFDAAVPHQTFPQDPRARWLVPVGYVRWVARQGTLGYFLQRDFVPGDNVDERIRAARQYAGLVTEYVHAADGNIVLHRRDEDPLAPNRFANLISSGGTSVAEHLRNLVWVEGNLRVGGDAKIAGGQLALRDAAGLTQGTSLYLDRNGDGSGVAGRRELRAVIGPTAETDNRFIVGPHDAATPPVITPQFSVVSSGRVGVNTADPVTTLDVRGDWNGTENGAVRVAGRLPTIRFGEVNGHANEQWIVQAEANGNLKFAHRTGPVEPAAGQWNSALLLTPTMTGVPGTTQPGVGIRSTAPRNPLAVRADGPWEELVSFEDAAGTTKWHINQKVNGTPGLNFAETGVADSRLIIKSGGDVGVGTAAPTNKLHVDGFTGIRQNRLYLSGGTGWSSLTYNAHRNAGNTAWVFPDPARPAITLELDDGNSGTRFEVFSTGAPSNTVWTSHFKIQGDSGNVLMAYAGGNVGIGTTAPLQKLHVAGAFLRVDGAGNEQAYIGGDGIANDVQVGSLNAGVGRVVLYNPAANAGMDLATRDIACNDVVADDILCDNITANFYNFSDAEFKSNIAEIDSPLDTIRALRGVQFQWKTEKRKGEADFGVVAQEVRRVLPQLVRDGKQGAMVSYMSLIPLLIEGMKELAAEVESLRGELGKLGKPAAPAKPRKPTKAS